MIIDKIINVLYDSVIFNMSRFPSDILTSGEAGSIIEQTE